MFVDRKVISICHTLSFFRYVPMFGETEYDPNRQYSSVSIEEQLDALGRAVDAGKVSDSLLIFCSIHFFLPHDFPLNWEVLFLAD